MGGSAGVCGTFLHASQLRSLYVQAPAGSFSAYTRMPLFAREAAAAGTCGARERRGESVPRRCVRVAAGSAMVAGGRLPHGHELHDKLMKTKVFNLKNSEIDR